MKLFGQNLKSFFLSKSYFSRLDWIMKIRIFFFFEFVFLTSNFQLSIEFVYKKIFFSFSLLFLFLLIIIIIIISTSEKVAKKMHSFYKRIEVKQSKRFQILCSHVLIAQRSLLLPLSFFLSFLSLSSSPLSSSSSFSL